MDALVVAGRSSKSTSANHCIDFHKDVVSDVTSQLITDEGKTMEKASLCYATLWRVVTQFLCFGKAATAQPLRPGRSPGSVAKRKLSLKDFNKEKQAATIEIRLINVYDCVCICSNLDMLIGIMDESMRSSFGCPDLAPEKQRWRLHICVRRWEVHWISTWMMLFIQVCQVLLSVCKKKKLSLNRCAQITGHGGHAKIITANPASFPSSLRKKNKVPGWMTIKWIQGICPPFATSKKWPKCPPVMFPAPGKLGKLGKNWAIHQQSMLLVHQQMIQQSAHQLSVEHWNCWMWYLKNQIQKKPLEPLRILLAVDEKVVWLFRQLAPGQWMSGSGRLVELTSCPLRFWLSPHSVQPNHHSQEINPPKWQI